MTTSFGRVIRVAPRWYERRGVQVCCAFLGVPLVIALAGYAVMAVMSLLKVGR